MSLKLERIQLKRYRKLKAGDSVEFSQVVTKNGYQIGYTVQMSKTDDGKTGQINIQYHTNNDPEYQEYEKSKFLLFDDQIVKAIHHKTEKDMEDNDFYWDITISTNFDHDQKHGLETEIRTLKWLANDDYQRKTFTEFTWDNGVISGPFSSTDLDGTQTLGHYFNGKEEGVWTVSNSKGDITERLYFINGQEVDQDDYLNSLRKELVDKEVNLFPDEISDLLSGYL